MKYLTDSFKQVSRLFVLLLATYFVIRILFYFFNYSIFRDMVGADVFRAVFYGFRYDFSAILYTNFIIFFLLLLPIKAKFSPGYQNIVRVFFILINIFAFSIAFADLVYFQFNLKRIDAEIFSLLGFATTLMLDFIKDFYLVFILFFALIWGLIKLSRGMFQTLSDEKFKFSTELITLLILLPIFIIGMRGGITNKRPLRIVDSSNYVPVKYTPLVTNSIFTFLTSMDGRFLVKKTNFSEQELWTIYNVDYTADGTQKDERLNVVILILESFSKQFTGQNTTDQSYTPFLDELMDSSLVCVNAYANGRRSSQGLVAVTSSIPALMDAPFMYSKYVNSKVYGLGSILQDHGYETFFFNGSEKHKLGWEAYIKSTGFVHNFGKGDYPNQEHYDGSWGIYDNYFYDFFIDEMSKAKRPFGSIFFTLSSHHPFKIPPEFQDRYSNTSEFLNALEYADYSLRLFFERARTTDWFDNTVFVITADHTYGANWNDGNSLTDKYKTRKGLYEIPILFYCPSKPELRGEINYAVQQTDIMPSLIDILDLNTYYVAFGQSVFSTSDQPRVAYQYLNGIYQITNEKYFLMHDGDKAISLYDFTKDELLENNLLESKPEIVKRMEELLNAIIQQHNNRLIHNDLINNKRTS